MKKIESKIMKRWDLSVDGLSLGFGLNVKDKKEVANFIKLLEEALVLVKKENE